MIACLEFGFDNKSGLGISVADWLVGLVEATFGSRKFAG